MANRNDTQDIAITGIGCCCAAGKDVETAWQTLQQGTVSCRRIPQWLFATDLDFPAFMVENDWILSHTPYFEIPDSCTRTVKLALTAVAEALVSAKINLDQLREKRVGVALGTTVGCTFDDEQYYIDWKKGTNPDLQPVFNYLDNNPAVRIQKTLKVRGPVAVITNACASGTDAIGVAKQWLESGLCDIALAGGADELSRIACHGFASLMLTAKKACRPFDESRRGLNLGEGAGIVLMEKEQDAKRRGVTPQGWVRGYGAASDAYHPTAPHPEGRGLQHAVKKALANAGVTTQDIALVNCHGTGTSANDLAEVTALHKLGFDSSRCSIVSTKGITGHTLGAAGAIESIFTLKTLQQKRSQGTIGCSTPDPAFPLTPCTEKDQRELHSSFGINQSLAFGGGNAALVIQGNIEE